MTNAARPIHERFPTLDAYLDHLRLRNAPIDKPWYKEIRPGVYELQSGGNFRPLGDQVGQRIFTRDELEKKFGFKK